MTKNNIEKVLDLTPMQKGMLFNYVKSGVSTYFVQKSVKLTGNFSTQNAILSLRVLSRKYEILRTSFFYKTGADPKQVVLKNRDIEYTVIKADEDSLKKIEEDEKSRGFDLSKDSLLRVAFVIHDDNHCTIIWNFNHIILDGWCMSILLREFFKYYASLQKGNSFDFIVNHLESVFDYKEYLNWLKVQDYDSAKNYWSNLVKDYQENGNIEPRLQYEQTDDNTGIISYFPSKSLINRISKLCLVNNITISTFFEFSWGLFLAKQNFVEDIIFGKVVSGRRASLQGIEEGLGLFINTVPTRLKLNEKLSYQSHLKLLYSQNLESEEHDFYPLFDTMKLNDLGTNLINSLFVFENYFIDEDALHAPDNIEVEIDNKQEFTEYPLSLSIIKQADYEIDINYHSEIFSKKEIELFMSHFVAIINDIVDNPDKKIANMTLTSFEEKKKLKDFSLGKNKKTSFTSIIEQFEHQVLLNPNTVAVKDANGSITYYELYRYISKIETKLIKSGIQSGDRLLILCNKTIDFIASVFASIKCGCTYVPVDKKFNNDRLLFILKDSGAKFVLSDFDKILEDAKCINVKQIEEYAEYEQSTASDNPHLYILYTSGTTGTPKGVLVKESSVINLVHFLNDEIYSKYSRTNTGMLANQIFDASVQQIFTSLLFGHTLHLINEDLKFDPKTLWNYLNINEIKILDGTPSYIELLISENQGQLGVENYLIGGEKLPPQLVKQIYTVSRQSHIYNVYGPTETTVDATYYLCNSMDDTLDKIPVGRPIYNTKIQVVNNQSICGIGMLGEIFISGDGVADGYVSFNKKNYTGFINWGSDKENGYLTGDIGYWNQEGQLEIVGRRDSQIKLNGHRIELSEIETLLIHMHAIKTY
ncbi:condensation domain-containing protein [Streptococcus ratti]|uniref:AMP-binding protein n=1 Tax=Streptococcus ratti TaxID=1341 RepID=A0A7X9LEY4_STRRT|nr:condensation domain-containing protein [Streptococcus ratti]NMD50023.1 AMP-binding protein [Streptococcus ratti]